VDGFRFDLMGHHMKSNMLAVRAALDALAPARDGVDGRGVYVYGEGWNFGEVADGARGVNATQPNMAGTGIGTFTDRLRDGVRGGGPFSDRREQGFATGLALDPNGFPQGTAAEQRARLLEQTDLVRLGLAGNLASYPLVDASGATRTGAELDYNGQPAGYARVPADTVSYVSAHDNETWFDALQVKLPAEAALAERVRVHQLGVSVVALAQGIPFFHAGDELLRSKSGDRNSYDSGDWFNRIDWTGLENGWGSGLPPAGDNQADWPVLGPLLADPALRPGPAEMAAARAHFEEMLAIRRATPLLRLRTEAEIRQALTFLNVGPGQIPGLVVMRLVSGAPAHGPYGQVVAAVNASPGDVRPARLAAVSSGSTWGSAGRDVAAEGAGCRPPEWSSSRASTPWWRGSRARGRRSSEAGDGPAARGCGSPVRPVPAGRGGRVRGRPDQRRVARSSLSASRSCWRNAGVSS